jgi:hypothetical protein
MMNAAAPKRDAPAAVLGTVNAKNLLAPTCHGEALRRVFLVNNFHRSGVNSRSCVFYRAN